MQAVMASEGCWHLRIPEMVPHFFISGDFNTIFWLWCRRSSQDEIVTNSTCCSNCCYCFDFLEAVVEWLLQQSTILQENVFLQNHFFLVSANRLVS